MSATQSVGKRAVIRVAIPWIMGAVDRCRELADLPGTSPYSGVWVQLMGAQQHLFALYNQFETANFLRASRPQGAALLDRISEITSKNPNQDEEVATWGVKYAADVLRPVLLAEISVLPSFLVTAKEGYDINKLIDEGYVLFPKDMLKKVRNTQKDAAEAGRALAFELGTACGFHTFRVVESVTRRYWEVVAQIDKPKLQTLGNYASELERGKFGDEKVWESLKQLARLHRNPIIHPEVILSVSEAIDILGIARSVIGMMIGVIPDEPETISSVFQQLLS